MKTATGTLLLGGDISKSWQAFLSGTIKNVYNVPENPEIESKVESGKSGTSFTYSHLSNRVPNYSRLMPSNFEFSTKFAILVNIFLN